MKILKKIFSITFIIFYILVSITVLAIIMFIVLLFASITHYTNEQTAIVENSNSISHIYDEYEPSIESIIANLILTEGNHLPLFPTIDLAPHRQSDMTDEEYEEMAEQLLNDYNLSVDEWFEVNGNAVIEILEAILLEIGSSFSNVNFSFSQRLHGSQEFRIIYADVATGLISDTDILYLLNAILGISRLGGGMSVLSFSMELNLDNGNQLFTLGKDNITYTIVYREQENITADQSLVDWWSIASGTINIYENTIKWRGFVEDENGNFNITSLSTSPFE